MRARVTRPRRGLRHAVRGPAPRRAGPGGRWLRRARPLLVGPPLDTVLLRPGEPLVVHDHPLHLVVRRSFVVGGDRTSVHPVVRHVERVTTRTTTLAPGRHDRPSAPPATGEGRASHAPSVLHHRHRPEEGPHRTAPHHPAALRPALALASPPRHLLPAQPPSAQPRGRSGAPALPAYSPARTPSYTRPPAPPSAATPPAPALTRPGVADTDPAHRAPGDRSVPVDVDDLTRRVVAAIDRRLVSHRERMGRR